MNQLVKHSELIGKTISQLLNSGNDIWIKFTDDSFVIFDTDNYSSGFSYDNDVRVICDDIKDNTSMELVELGLITKIQYEIALKEEEDRHEQERLKRDLEYKNKIEEQEKELLNKLKNKYE